MKRGDRCFIEGRYQGCDKEQVYPGSRVKVSCLRSAGLAYNFARDTDNLYATCAQRSKRPGVGKLVVGYVSHQ